MCRQALGKGLPLLDSLKDILDHSLNLGSPGELLADREAAIQRQPRIDQRREFLSKEHDLLGTDAAEAPTEVQLEGRASLPRCDLQWGHTHALQADRYGFVRHIVQCSLDDAPVLSNGFVEECGHG